MNIPHEKFSLNRTVSEELINDLKTKYLYKEKLLPDIKKGEIFPAIRENKVAFYYKNQRLFVYDKNGFKTHIKYALTKRATEDYYTEDDLKKCSFNEFNFEEEYDAMKKLSSKYAGEEGIGVSMLYKHNFFKSPESDYYLLDIEVKLKGNKQDRMDVLFYSKKEKSLKFFETKHYSNQELWAKSEKNHAVVVDQIEKYENLIKDNKEVIVKGYSDYIRSLNLLFDLDIPEPLTCEESVPLFVFGFDNDQKNGRLKKLLEEDSSLKNGLYFFRGSSDLDQNSIDKKMWSLKKGVF